MIAKAANNASACVSEMSNCKKQKTNVADACCGSAEENTGQISPRRVGNANCYLL